MSINMTPIASFLCFGGFTSLHRVVDSLIHGQHAWVLARILAIRPDGRDRTRMVGGAGRYENIG